MFILEMNIPHNDTTSVNISVSFTMKYGKKFAVYKLLNIKMNKVVT